VVNPFALKVLAAADYPTDGFISKAWDIHAAPGAPVMDFVFTVCDAAAGETCPVWPGQPMTAHWGIKDPATRGTVPFPLNPNGATLLDRAWPPKSDGVLFDECSTSQVSFAPTP